MRKCLAASPPAFGVVAINLNKAFMSGGNQGKKSREAILEHGCAKVAAEEQYAVST